ncbi:transposase [Senegalia massiliensis]|uniref:Transposase IS116/IS110/IS902 C-terminal domain-containing protein n=1 Tax=Senegalia massiliensis TaxID=1720316 RepID=A0A845R0M5_9CLOT|nr:hypothetical protein [Senegalia massiliensis]
MIQSKGVGFISTVTLICEIYDFLVFKNHKHFFAYLSLILL